MQNSKTQLNIPELTTEELKKSRNKYRRLIFVDLIWGHDSSFSKQVLSEINNSLRIKVKPVKKKVIEISSQDLAFISNFVLVDDGAVMAGLSLYKKSKHDSKLHIPTYDEVDHFIKITQPLNFSLGHVAQGERAVLRKKMAEGQVKMQSMRALIEKSDIKIKPTIKLKLFNKSKLKEKAKIPNISQPGGELARRERLKESKRGALHIFSANFVDWKRGGFSGKANLPSFKDVFSEAVAKKKVFLFNKNSFVEADVPLSANASQSQSKTVTETPKDKKHFSVPNISVNFPVFSKREANPVAAKPAAPEPKPAKPVSVSKPTQKIKTAATPAKSKKAAAWGGQQYYSAAVTVVAICAIAYSIKANRSVPVQNQKVTMQAPVPRVASTETARSVCWDKFSEYFKISNDLISADKSEIQSAKNNQTMQNAFYAMKEKSKYSPELARQFNQINRFAKFKDKWNINNPGHKVADDLTPR